jgi:hypothetical protein
MVSGRRKTTTNVPMATDQIYTIYLGVTSRQMMTPRIYK